MAVNHLNKQKHFPLHPLLWVVFPPLALLGNNIAHVPTGDAVHTLIVSMLLSLLVWGIFRLLMGNWSRGALGRVVS